MAAAKIGVSTTAVEKDRRPRDVQEVAIDALVRVGAWDAVEQLRELSLRLKELLELRLER